MKFRVVRLEQIGNWQIFVEIGGKEALTLRIGNWIYFDFIVYLKGEFDRKMDITWMGGFWDDNILF